MPELCSEVIPHEWGNIDVERNTKYIQWPLGTRLVASNGCYRYMFDGNYYQWIEEDTWEKLNKFEHPERYFNKETLEWVNKLIKLNGGE